MSVVLDAVSELTGAAVSMNELVSVIVQDGQLNWRDIALKLGWKFEKTRVLENDHPYWTSKEKLQDILSDYERSKGDNETSRQRLIDACNEVGIGGTLRDALNVRK